MTTDTTGTTDPDDVQPLIAVTGMACRFPGADSPAEYWNLLREGAAPLEEVPREELLGSGRPREIVDAPSYVPWRKPFSDPSLFDAEFFGLTPAEAAATDPQQRILLQTAVHALEDAGLDPAAPPAGVGVYLGMNHSDYLLSNVLGHPEVIRGLGWHRVLMGNDRGFTATSLSYRLGLTGPSIAVDCACSSSLAAVHQACRALLNYDTDVALAGGSAIRPHDVGYMYTEGGIASPDGLCRPFSAQAAGTVFASGAGLVVLRRLEDALADGDRVLAVIRASDMNNDGAAKSGYTAPSLRGQEAVIASTHRLAGITADEVSYVEAHGTGTPLGDPIEVEALTRAFRQSTDRIGFCAIGSTKSNIGHLDSAAGIAGLIKVVLSLRHRTLPASPGAEETNPHIDFVSSPFRVNHALRTWSAPGPLIAGVSAFGVGGTNVHLLVEEPPETPEAPRPAVPDTLVLPFSARSPEALDRLEVLLRGRLAGLSAHAVADVGSALVRSRSGHPLRRALLWRSSGTCVTLPGTDRDTTPRPPAFLLRNTSEQPFGQKYLDALVAGRPAFRETARRLVGPWAAGRGTTADRALESLVEDAPALLTDSVVALGCAAVWAEHGVTPGAVLADHRSWLAAAVLTGVFSEEDASGVLAGRATTRPLGDMLRNAARPAAVAWYDPDGSEWCSPGVRPDLAAVSAGSPATPGRRRLPPKISAVVCLPTGPGSGAVLPAVFGDAVAVVFPGLPPHEALAAGLGHAWALGLGGEAAAFAATSAGGCAELPGYPFERRRHWLDPVSPVSVPYSGSGSVRPEEDPEDLEESAREIFRAALGVTEVSARDSLFDLGGDSLLATRVVAEARSRWRRPIPVGSFLSDPSPASLARLAGDHERVNDAPAVRHQGGIRLPVTSLQERFLFLSEVEGAAEAYNVPVLADLRGSLDADALREALRDVLRRHESLRAVFHTSARGTTQEILADVAVDLPVVDVADEAELRREITRMSDRTISLDVPPLLRSALLRTAPDRHVLVLVVHHIVADAFSTGLLLRDLYACYAGRTGSACPVLPPVEGLLAAHVRAEEEWLASSEADRQLGFWLAELNDRPEPLELPGDRPRQAGRHRGDTVAFTASAEVSRRVTDLASRTRSTPFSVVLAVFAVLLSRVGGRDEFLVGVPVSGRHRPHARDLVGNFVNTLPLRISVDRTRPFADLHGALARRVVAALDHQDLPFEVLSRKLREEGGPEQPPLLDVLFNMLSPDASVPDPPDGLRALPVPFERGTSPYELSLDWWFGRDGTLAGRFVFDTQRFDRATVVAWQESFVHALDTLTRAPNGTIACASVEPPEAAAEVSALLSGPVVPVPAMPVHAVFARQAARTPDRLAVHDGRSSLTYGRLSALSAAVAARLTELGVTHGESVGIAMERGVPLIAGLLGALRAGATAVPFDLTLPRKRLATIAEDCRPRFVLCADAKDAEFAPFARAVSLPAVDGAAADGPTGPVPGDSVDLGAGAYLTYTSGTTGRPKGIHFPHRALANLIHWETSGHTSALRWMQLASFGFDAAFHETFAALCSGGSLFVADEATKHDHDLFAGFVREHGVEKAIVPVSLLHALAARFARDVGPFASLREVASTGEQLRVSESLIDFFERLDGCALINNYGPAETHVVTSYRFTGPPRAWPRHAPIGSPVQNVVLEIQDDRGRAVPRGAVGELAIGGDCVATGYLGRPDLTAERFRTDGGARSYRSGDRARLSSLGHIDFVGRADQQIKIRGYRVEPGEVEVAVRRDPDVRDVALVASGPDGDRRLDAYLVAAPAAQDLAGRLRRRLREDLPAAMVPSSFTVVDALPVNGNGKVDPTRLPAPGAGPASRSGHAAPEDRATTDVLAVFRQVLGRPELDADEDFFDAGGHSLLATRLMHVLRERTGVRLGIPELYRWGTAAELARLVAERGPSADAAEEELPPSGPPVALPPGLRPLVRASSEFQKTFVFAASRPLDPARVRAAAAAVLARHPALRLFFPDMRRKGGAYGERPVLAEPGAVPVRVGASRGTGTAAANSLHDEAQGTPIDPAREPLVRLTVSGNLLAVTVHLLVLDGRGMLTLCHEIAEACRADSPPVSEDPRPAEVDDGFLRYLSWRHALGDGPRAREAARVWHEILPAEAGDRPHVGPLADRLSWAPTGRLHDALRSLCSDLRVTPFVVHLTAFAMALAKADGREDVCPAVPLDGRCHSDLDRSVGGFANTVPVPLSIPVDGFPASVLTTVRDAFDRIRELRTVPFADLAADDPALRAFGDLPVVFNYARDDGNRPDGLRGVGPDPLAPRLRVHFTVVDAGKSFRVSLKYARGASEVQDAQLLDHYRQALYTLAFSAGPGAGAAGAEERDGSVMERI